MKGYTKVIVAILMAVMIAIGSFQENANAFNVAPLDRYLPDNRVAVAGGGGVPQYDEVMSFAAGQYTRHFHLNNYENNPAVRFFGSFTGTFFSDPGWGANRYHYTIDANGGQWQGGNLPPVPQAVQQAMADATQARLNLITTP
jgi:hypothetical protein